MKEMKGESKRGREGRKSGTDDDGQARDVALIHAKEETLTSHHETSWGRESGRMTNFKLAAYETRGFRRRYNE